MNAPQTSEGPLAGGPIAEQNTGNIAIVGDAEAERKRWATLQARLALRGVSLKRLPGGDYLVCSWNLSKPLSDVQAVEAFAEKVGA